LSLTAPFNLFRNLCATIFSKLYSMLNPGVHATTNPSQCPIINIDPTADTQTDRDKRLLAALGNFMRPRPIPNSYWATQFVLACEYPWCPNMPNDSNHPSKPKLDALLKAGVRTFIDLTESGELLPYASELLVRASLLNIDEKEIEYHRFPIRDRSLPESVEYMHTIMHVLRENEERGRISGVHCRGGIGRTGMVIGCWLVASGRAKDGEEALEIIARQWRGVAKSVIYHHSPETGPQFEFVLNFHPEKPREQLAF